MGSASAYDTEGAFDHCGAEQSGGHGSQQGGVRIHQSGASFLRLLARHMGKLALITTRLHLRTRLEQCPWLTKSTGPLIHQSRLLPHPPVPRLPPLHLRLRYRAPPNGLLELGHLHHHLMGRRALVVQREAERKDSIIIREKGLLGGLQRQAEPRRVEVDGGCGER